MDRYRSGHNGPDSKSGSLARGSWVRIPPCPPKEKPPPKGGGFSFGIPEGDSNGSGVRKRAGGTFSPRPGLRRSGGRIPPKSAIKETSFVCRVCFVKEESILTKQSLVRLICNKGNRRKNKYARNSRAGHPPCCCLQLFLRKRHKEMYHLINIDIEILKSILTNR